jgi:hypothetical protein
MKEITKESEFSLKIVSDHFGFARTFQSRNEFIGWLSQESEKFLSFMSSGSDELRQTLSQASRTIRQINPEDDSETIKRTINQAISEGFFPSDTETGRFLYRIKDIITPNSLSITVKLVTKRANINEFNFGNRDVNIGASAAIAFLGIGDPRGNTEALRQAVNDASNARKQAQMSVQQIEKFMTSIDEEWKQKLEAYETKVAMKAPTSYWRERYNYHKAQAKTARNNWNFSVAIFGISIVFLSIFIFSGSLEKIQLTKALISSAENTSSNLPQIERVKPSASPPSTPVTLPENHTNALSILSKFLQSAIVFGTLLGLGIWVLRQKLRKALSHEHLAEDAAERVTMVETFAALKNAGLAGGEFGPILTALYRPASTGLVADDGPVTPLEIIVKEAARKTSGGSM